MDNKKNSEFIIKLYDIIEKYPEFINWSQNGKQLQILDIFNFQLHVLPLYFRHTKLSSLIRQFNMYGFSKKVHTSTSLVFEHPIFCKGNQHNFKNIQRKTRNIQKRAHIKSNQIHLTKIQNSIKIPQELKSPTKKMLIIEQELEQTFKGIKSDLLTLIKELKDCRSKSVIQISQQIQSSSKNLDLMIEQAKKISQFLIQQDLDKDGIENLANQSEISILAQLNEKSDNHNNNLHQMNVFEFDYDIENELELPIGNQHFNL